MKHKFQWITSLKEVSFAAIITFCLMGSADVCAQNNNYVGVSIGAERVGEYDFRPRVGLTFESELSAHNGYQVGASYRSEVYKYDLTIDQNTYPKEILVSYISLPLLYKFRSNVLNFYVGSTFDFYVGWTDKSMASDSKTTHFSTSDKFEFCFLTKLSKSFVINDKLNVEPEFFINPLFNTERVYWGFTVALKYGL